MSVEELELKLFALRDNRERNANISVREAVKMVCEQAGLSNLATQHILRMIENYGSSPMAGRGLSDG